MNINLVSKRLFVGDYRYSLGRGREVMGREREGGREGGRKGGREGGRKEGREGGRERGREGGRE